MTDRLTYRQELTVRDVDIDELGHVNNAVYLAWIDDCCRAHVEHLGMPISTMLELGVLPVVRRHVATYRSSAMSGERLIVSTRVVRVRGPLATRHNEVRREEDGTLLVEVETDWVWMDTSTGRPKAPPAQVMGAFGLEAGDRM